MVQQRAKRRLAVGHADRLIQAVLGRDKVHQIAVVCKHPMPSPQLAHERVTVFQRDHALRCFADVRDHVERLDRIRTHQIRHGRADGRLTVNQQATRAILEKRNAPTIRMMIGQAAAFGKAFKRKHDVRGGVAIHSEQLAHI